MLKFEKVGLVGTRHCLFRYPKIMLAGSWIVGSWKVYDTL